MLYWRSSRLTGLCTLCHHPPLSGAGKCVVHVVSCTTSMCTALHSWALLVKVALRRASSVALTLWQRSNLRKLVCRFSLKGLGPSRARLQLMIIRSWLRTSGCHRRVCACRILAAVHCEGDSPTRLHIVCLLCKGAVMLNTIDAVLNCKWGLEMPTPHLQSRHWWLTDLQARSNQTAQPCCSTCSGGSGNCASALPLSGSTLTTNSIRSTECRAWWTTSGPATRGAH